MEPVVTPPARPAKGWELTVLTFSVLGLMVLINVWGTRHPQTWDVTRAKQFTLSDQSRLIVSKLTQPVKIMAFVSDRGREPARRQQIQDILSMYRKHSPRIEVETVDMDREPQRAEAFGVTEDNTVVFECGTRRKSVAPHNVFGWEDGKQSFRGEQHFTNAIMTVLDVSQRTVYFTQGHGERGLDDLQKTGLSDWKNALQLEQVAAKSVVLAQAGAVPADAEVLVIAGPKNPFIPQEVDMLRSYLTRKGKGRLIILLEPGARGGLDPFLKEWGVEAYDDFTFDLKRYQYPLPFLLLPNVTADHPITGELARGDAVVVLNGSRSLGIRDAAGDRGLAWQALLETSENSWGETDLKSKTPKPDGKDRKGPFAVALSVTRKGATEEPVMVVAGDVDMASNALMPAAANKDFLMNSVHWLVGEKMMITIRPKAVEAKRTRPMTLEDAQIVFWTSVVGTPLLVIALGLAVWWIRRL